MDSSPVTVHVLTGFLGSGKTTLLNRLLRAPDLSDTAIIVNEFGEIPLDHLLVQSVAGEAVVLANGCVCCTVRDDLAGALIELLEGAARGSVPRFSRVIIETTGLADPVPVLGTLRSHPIVRHHVRRGLVVATVDARDGSIARHPGVEAVHQVSAADWVVITKTDLVDAAREHEVAAAVRSLNPLAEVTSGTGEAVRRLIALTLDGAEVAVKSMPPLVSADHRHHHRAVPVTSFSMVLSEPVDWPAFGIWSSALLHAHGDRILRFKGLIDCRGSDAPVFINGVRQVLHRPIHLDRWPDGDRRSRLVFIVSGVDPDRIRRSLARWLAQPVEV